MLCFRKDVRFGLDSFGIIGFGFGGFIIGVTRIILSQGSFSIPVLSTISAYSIEFCCKSRFSCRW
jgi:hypothetical protein